jgi:hypothetical protein
MNLQQKVELAENNEEKKMQPPYLKLLLSDLQGTGPLDGPCVPERQTT